MRTLTLLVALIVASSGVLSCRKPPAPAPARTRAAVIADWQAIKEDDQRLAIAQELVRDNHLIGLTEGGVVQALGPSHPRILSTEYGDIKYVVGPNGIDDLWLCIHLDSNSRVSSAQIRSD